MRRWLLLWLGWLGLVGLLQAQPLAGKSHVQVQLVSAGSAVVPGEELQLGLRFKMDPHWHVYWINPGDSGYPPKVEWKLPAGFQAGPLSWPVPKRMELTGLQSFVYEGEVILPVKVQVPADLKAGDTVKLQAQVEWLACEKTCIPGEAQVELQLPVALSTQPSAEVAGLQSQLLPESAGNIELRAWRLGADKAFIEFRGMPGDQVDFFPSLQGAPVSQPAWKPDKGLEIAVKPEDKKLQGLLVVENGGKRQGISLDVPLADKPPVAAPGPATQAPASTWTLATALPSAFLGGMILNLMPCVFPVLSLKALSLLHHNEGEGGPAWAQGWVYTLGVVVSVLLIAAPILLVSSGGERLGWGWQMQSPIFVYAMAVLFLAIALNLFGLFEVGESLTQLASVAEGKKGLSESFWSGAVATVAATPCTAPFMAGAVGFAVLQSPLVAMSIFACLGLGIAFPYLLLCGFPATRRWLPRPGAWMESFKQGMGFPMLAAVVWFLYILANLLQPEGLALGMGGLVMLSLAAWIFGRWGYNPEGSIRSRAKLAAFLVALVGVGGAASVVSRSDMQGGPTVQHEVGGLEWVNFSPAEVTRLRAEGKPVFIDFTAAWCVNCKLNEQGVLRNGQVVKAFQDQGVVTMKADWTRRDPVISQALREFGRTGVPFYVLYPKKGEPVLFPEILTTEGMLQALATANG